MNPDTIKTPYDGIESKCDSVSNNNTNLDSFDHIEYGSSNYDNTDPTIVLMLTKPLNFIDQDWNCFSMKILS